MILLSGEIQVIINNRLCQEVTCTHYLDIGKGVPMSSDISVSNCAAWGSPTNSKNVQIFIATYVVGWLYFTVIISRISGNM